MKKKSTIAIVAVLVLALGTTAFAMRGRIVNLYRNTFLSPKKYYKTVEKNAVNDFTASYMAHYEKTHNTSKSKVHSNTGTLKYTPGSSARKALVDISPAFSFFKSADITINSSVENELLSCDSTLSINDTDFLSFNAFMDAAKGEAYCILPELSDKYLYFSKDFDEYSSLFDTFNKSLASDSNVNHDVITKIIKKYSYKLIDSDYDVTSGNATVTAGGFSKKCKVLNAKMSGFQFYECLDNILATAKKDEDLKNTFSGMIETAHSLSDEQDTDDPYYDTISDLQASVKKEKSSCKKDDTVLSVTIYIDSTGNIVERDIDFGEDSENFSYKRKFILDGANYGLSLSITDNSDTIIDITGSGKASLSNLSGDFKIFIPSLSSTVNVKINKCDVSKLAEGYFNGEINIKLENSKFTDLNLNCSITSKKNECTATVDIANGNQSYGTLAFSSSSSEKATVNKPKDTSNAIAVTDSDTLSNYFDSLDFQGYMENYFMSNGFFDFIGLK